MPVEGVVPKAEVITGAATEPVETTAPGMTEEVHEDALPALAIPSKDKSSSIGTSGVYL
jgi:hypothetical protein